MERAEERQQSEQRTPQSAALTSYVEHKGQPPLEHVELPRGIWRAQLGHQQLAGRLLQG